MRFPISTRGPNEFFVGIVNFLDSLTSIGVTRIASNWGVASVPLNQGFGFQYWDQQFPPGSNAFGVWRFGNAAVPFNIFVTLVNVNTETVSPTTPSTLSFNPSSSTNRTCVAISIAQRLDGTNPWNGGTANAGADSKGTPFWTPGSSTLIAYPRVNSIQGASVANREAMMFISSYAYSSNENYNDHSSGPMRAILLADENNFLLLTDLNLDNAWQFFYFGKYVPRPSLNIQVPYVCLHQNNISDPAVTRKNWGSPAVQLNFDWTSLGDGGIVHPVASNGVKVVFTDYSSMFFDVRFAPNRTVGSVGRYDMIPIFLGMNDITSNTYGLMGSIDFFRLTYGLPSGFMSNDRKLLVIGNGLTASGKMVVPWDGATSLGSGNSRVGVSF